MSVETVDLVVEGQERLLLDGLHGDLVRAAAQLREGRPALAAFQHLPVLEMPDVGHRLLGHALDLALLLARAVGLGSEDAVHLGAQANVLQDPGGEGHVLLSYLKVAIFGAPAAKVDFAYYFRT